MTEAHDFWSAGEHDLTLLSAKAGSDDMFERWAAAFELGETRDPASVDLLKTLLGDDDEHVREAAEVALTKLGHGDEVSRARVLERSQQLARAAQRHRMRTHLEAAPYVAWKLKPVPIPDKTNMWIVEAMLFDAIQVEGPVTGSRLFRSYCGGARMLSSATVSTGRLHKALESLLKQGKVVRSDDFTSEHHERWVLHERGTPGVVLRQRGPRELRDIPPDEVRAAIAASAGRLGARGIDRDRAFEQILQFYQAERELDLVGKLLANEWSGLMV